jgi:hypothetical protein
MLLMSSFVASPHQPLTLERCLLRRTRLLLTCLQATSVSLWFKSLRRICCPSRRWNHPCLLLFIQLAHRPSRAPSTTLQDAPPSLFLAGRLELFPLRWRIQLRFALSSVCHDDFGPAPPSSVVVNFCLIDC